MVSEQSVKLQLRRIGFDYAGWGRTEVRELHKILLPDEEIQEVVNGFYEGGFALLVATDIRVLLIDKKPLNYLTVEDLRFDMINEMDYNHRVIGANINIATGNKALKFTSLNQPRLRSLISRVQHNMALIKRQQTTSVEDQKAHLEQINANLHSYLDTQQEQQRMMSEMQAAQAAQSVPPPPQQALDEMYADGYQEVFGRAAQRPMTRISIPIPGVPSIPIPNPLEINPMKIAYSKLPLALRNRRFGGSGEGAESVIPPIAPAVPEAEPPVS